jgi:DNA-binding response OmpR family regulator
MDDAAHLQREVQELREELECARVVISDMRKAIRRECEWWPKAGTLTPYEQIVFGLLLRRRRASRSQIFDFMYGDRIEDPPDPKIIDIFVSRMRRKLKGTGIQIVSVKRFGFMIEIDEQAIKKSNIVRRASEVEGVLT